MDESDLPDPLSARPVEGSEWSAGETPWLRSWQSSTLSEPGLGYAQCLMCGAQTLKLSAGDLWADPGRLTLYCDNMNCEAREMELIVTRDSDRAINRADVRALRAIDDGKSSPAAEPEPEPVKFVRAKPPGAAPDTRLSSRTDRGRQSLEY